MGSVIAPVDATLAEAEPEIEPNSADERTRYLGRAGAQAAGRIDRQVHESRAGSPAADEGAEHHEHGYDVYRDAGQRPEDAALGNRKGAEQAEIRNAGMSELTRQPLAPQPVGQRDQRHRRQRQTYCAPRHLQHDQQQHQRERDLEPAVEAAVLFIERFSLDGDVGAGRDADQCERSNLLRGEVVRASRPRPRLRTQTRTAAPAPCAPAGSPGWA